MPGINEIIWWKRPEIFSWGSSAFSQLKKKWRSIFIPLIIALYTWVLAGIFYKLALTLLVLPHLETTPRARSVAQPSGSGTALIYRAIYERNLFGSAETVIQTVTPPVAAEPAGRPAETKPPPVLSLELKGTVAGDRLTAFAAIRERGKPSDVLYRIGDTVGGATLKEIKRGEVLVEFGGEMITLRLASSPLAPVLPTPGGGAASTPPQPPAAPASGTGERVTITRAEVATQLSDMGGLLTQAQIRPFFQAGAPNGFMLSQIRPGSIYEKMTLRDGDIIQEANDRRLRGAEDMVEFYNLLKGAPSVSLKVMRGGRVETLNYDLR